MAEPQPGTGTAPAKPETTGTTPAQTTSGTVETKPDAGTTTETKPTTTTTEPASKAGQAAPVPKAPEKYALVVPEATKAYADAAFVQRVESIARANEWSNEDAQAALEEHLEAVRLQATTWESETKADKDYGGDKLSETQRLAQKVIDRVRPQGHARRDGFLSFLGRGGAGNHIEVVSFLADLGRLMSEDSPAHGRSIAGPPGDAASTLYDHPTSKALEEAARR